MSRRCRVCGPQPANPGMPRRKKRKPVCPSCRAAIRALKRETVRDRGHRGAECEVAGILGQARISNRNITRLIELAASVVAPPDRTRDMAALALEVARIAPELKNRPDRLRQNAPDLIPRLRKYRLALWEERRVKHPERIIRNRLEAQRMAEAPPPEDVLPGPMESETFGDPWGYYVGSLDNIDDPDFNDAYYWAFVRDDDDECVPALRAKHPKKKKAKKTKS